MARVIDKDYLLTHKRKVRFFGIGPDDESWGYAVPVEVIENATTLTPPNESLTLEQLIKHLPDEPYKGVVRRILLQAPVVAIDSSIEQLTNRCLELDRLYTQIQCLTGFTVEDLLEKFAEGYVLVKPT